MENSSLDDPARLPALQRLIRTKPGLRQFYEDVYHRYAATLARCPAEGIALELGSGGGFAKESLPSLTTSDVLPYAGVDCVADATRLPFAEQSLRAILMLNVFHHIADVAAFFDEAVRCLRPGGRVLIVDQYRGWISRPILRYLHHEPYDETASHWQFSTTGPLSGANGALAWMVFERDLRQFEERWPLLRVAASVPQSPLLYWLSGGMKRWTLVPRWGVRGVGALDRWLLRCSPRLASFVDIELVRVTS